MLKDDILKALLDAGDYCSGQALCERFHVTRTAVWKAVAKLRDEGYTIEARQNRGYLLRNTGYLLSQASLDEAFGDQRFLKRWVFLQQTDSTNLEVKRAAGEGDEGPTLFVAEEQTAGRGRRGRNWSSPPGSGIWMSLLLRPKLRPERASMLTLVTALAVTDGIREVTGLEAAIKWPNDVVVRGKKVAGILTEMSTDLDRIEFVVIGIGINVNTHSFPEEIREVATSLAIEQGMETARTPIIAAVWKQFARYEKLFEEKGSFTALKERYEALLANRGREVRVLDPDGEYCGVAEGITEGGELLVRREDQSLTAVRSGVVSVRGIYGYI